MNIQLATIFIYPIKSLAGIGVDQWPVHKTGLLYDRKWMLVDENGGFLSQRSLPRMALIHTAIFADNLIISADGMPDLSLPLHPLEGEPVICKVWHDDCCAVSVSAEADDWFSRCLNIKCRLVFQPDSSLRAVDPVYAKPDDQTSFSDGFPFLIVSENALADLNRFLDKPVDMRRFRPNLVVSGCGAFAEDEWREISIGTIDFRLPKPCSRCSVPAIDPDSGMIGKEPLTTLGRLRQWHHKIYFGQNALHDQCGVLSVGDSVLIRAYGSKQPPL